MKEMIGYVGSGKSTFLANLKTNDIKHVNVGFRTRIVYVFLFLLFKPNKYKYLFYFKSIKNCYIYMYLIGLKLYEKYSKHTFFLDQGFGQLIASELYLNDLPSKILYNELLKNANDNTMYFINISKEISFDRFLGRKVNKSRVLSNQDWYNYSAKIDKVLKMLNSKIFI